MPLERVPLPTICGQLHLYFNIISAKDVLERVSKRLGTDKQEAAHDLLKKRFEGGYDYFKYWPIVFSISFRRSAEVMLKTSGSSD